MTVSRIAADPSRVLATDWGQRVPLNTRRWERVSRSENLVVGCYSVLVEVRSSPSVRCVVSLIVFHGQEAAVLR